MLGSRHTTSEKKSSVDKERVKAVDGKDVSFWLLLEGALGDVLSPAETATLIGKMKKVLEPFPPDFLKRAELDNPVAFGVDFI